MSITKIVAAVAREQGDSVVDLERIKADVRVAGCQDMITCAWALFDTGCVSADLAEQILQAAERHIDREILTAMRRPSIADRIEQAWHRAAHQARRGVRKVRGAK